MSDFRNQLIPYIQFRSKSVICYDQYDYPYSGPRLQMQRNRAKMTWQEHTAYSGQITKGSKKRLSKAVSLLVQSSKSQILFNPVTSKNIYFKISFITLTIPKQTTSLDARYCYTNLLKPMLRKLRTKYGLKSYVWKAELQKNGMIHYHITSNLFIIHTALRDEWNNILRRNNLLVGFHLKTGHYNPNSTDVHAVSKIRDMEAYLVKYVSKEYQNYSKLNGKVWDCSKNLKENPYFTTIRDSVYEEKLKQAECKREVKVFTGERFRIFKFTTKLAATLMNDNDYKEYFNYLNKIRTWENRKPSTVLII